MYKYRHHEDESFKHNIKTRTQCLLGNTSKNIMMKSKLILVSYSPHPVDHSDLMLSMWPCVNTSGLK